MTDTIELRMRVREALLDEMRGLTGDPDLKATDLVREALTLFRWAANERAEGRTILSGNAEGEVKYRLVLPSLERVPLRSPAPSAAPAAAE